MGSLHSSPMAIEANICSMVSSISDMSVSLDFSTVDDKVEGGGGDDDDDAVVLVVAAAAKSDRYMAGEEGTMDDGIVPLLLLVEGSWSRISGTLLKSGKCSSSWSSLS